VPPIDEIIINKVIEEAKKWIRVNSQPSNFEGVWPIAIMTDLITELESKNKEIDELKAVNFQAVLEVETLNNKIEKQQKEIERLEKICGSISEKGN